MSKFLLPNCCQAARDYPTAVVQVDVYEGDSQTNEAEWVTSVFDDLQEPFSPSRYTPGPSPEFCTYCGEKLRELQRKSREPKKVCRVTDGGYYCDTCGKRLIECKCLPPSSAWEFK